MKNRSHRKSLNYKGLGIEPCSAQNCLTGLSLFSAFDLLGKYKSFNSAMLNISQVEVLEKTIQIHSTDLLITH